jgi:hypothetical protein
MSTKKGLDLAAGRLTDIAAGPPSSRPSRTKKASAYSRKRLGITSDKEADAAQRAKPAPPSPEEDRRSTEEDRPTPLLQERAAARARHREAAAKGQFDWLMQEEASQEDAGASPGDESLFRKIVRRPKALAAGAGTVLAVSLLLVWGLSGSDEPDPQAPSATRTPRPARPRPPSPKRPAPARGNQDARAPTRTNRTPSPAPAVAAARPKPEPGKIRVGAANVRPPVAGRPSAKPAPRPKAANPLLATIASLLNRAKPQPDPSAVTRKSPGATSPAKPAGSGKAAKPPSGRQPWQYMSCPPGIRCTGVFQQPTGSIATINGRFLRVGDRANGAKVVRISPMSVEMELDGKRFLVAISPERVRPDRSDEGEGEEGEEAEEDEEDEPDADDDDSQDEPSKKKRSSRSGSKKKSKRPDEDDR